MKFRILLLLSLAGCSASIPEGEYVCTADDDCPDRWVCRVESTGGTCYRSASSGDANVDGDSGDGSTGDGSMGDGGTGEVCMLSTFDFQPLTLDAAWSAFSPGLAQPTIATDSLGRVYLRGVVTKTGSAVPAPGDVIATLPVNLRPPARLVFSTAAALDAGGPGRLDIATDGTITWQRPTPADGESLSLDGIVFDPRSDRWTVATLPSAGWNHYGSGFGQVEYTRDVAGIVHLRGLASASGAPDNSVIFTLPAGYRPEGSLAFSTAITIGAGDVYGGRVDILSDGTVRFRAGTGFDSGFVSLSGVSFRPAGAPGTWASVSYVASASDFGNSFEPVRAFRDCLGIARVQGALTNQTTTPTIGTKLFSLPSGHFPSANLVYSARTAGTSGSGRFDIKSDGGGTYGYGNATFISVSGFVLP